MIINNGIMIRPSTGRVHGEGASVNTAHNLEQNGRRYQDRLYNKARVCIFLGGDISICLV